MLVKSNNVIWLNSILLESKAGVNFTNILKAAFAPISLRQESTNLKCKYDKATQKTFVQKSRE
jgi:hypothetical protein